MVEREVRKFTSSEIESSTKTQLIIIIMRVIKSRRLRWAGHVARMEEGRGVHKVLVGKPDGKRQLGRPRRRWEGNIKM